MLFDNDGVAYAGRTHKRFQRSKRYFFHWVEADAPLEVKLLAAPKQLRKML